MVVNKTSFTSYIVQVKKLQSIYISFSQSLLKNDILPTATLQAAIEKAQAKNQSLITYLAENKILDGDTLAKSVAEHFQLPQINLSKLQIDNTLLNSIDEKFIKQHLILPLAKTSQHLQVAVIEPGNNQALAELKFHTGLSPQLHIANYQQLLQTIDALISKKQYAAIKDLKEIPLHNSQDDAPIIRFVQQILNDAVQKDASDIHFEPYENFYRIRMRVDGVLYEITHSPILLATRIAARIKVMSKLDIAEKRLPQDGRFTLTTEKESRECRVSSCPTLFGEKIVVRILDNNNLILKLDELGFEEQQKNLFINAIERPQGMILVTGPTGSGKTVTLYTALNKLNTLDQNISTVEDPVEITLAGINQVNINPKIGLTFANVLRTFLRQDPDTIMIGEIRDLETAEIAVKAAQTGHLVLSTLHTNSAAETLTRLMNMGIASFNIGSSLLLIIAQRLARRLCQHCKKSVKIPVASLLQQGFSETDINNLEIFTASECQHCNQGYKGRIAIYEMLAMTEIIAQLIMSNAHSLEIANAAKNAGMQLLRRSALNKVKLGITSLEEINRVIGI